MGKKIVLCDLEFFGRFRIFSLILNFVGFFMLDFHVGFSMCVYSSKYCCTTGVFYRDFKNKLQKVDGDFRPFRSSEMHEIVCTVIIKVGFLKIEYKNLVIRVVEEL